MELVVSSRLLFLTEPAGLWNQPATPLLSKIQLIQNCSTLYETQQEKFPKRSVLAEIISCCKLWLNGNPVNFRSQHVRMSDVRDILGLSSPKDVKEEQPSVSRLLKRRRSEGAKATDVKAPPKKKRKSKYYTAVVDSSKSRACKRSSCSHIRNAFPGPSH